MFHPKIVPATSIKDGAILIIDVDYRETHAIVAGVLIQDWDSTECAVLTARIDDVQEYEPGAFYKRELPCILEIIKHVPHFVELGCIVVDGYVHLGEDQHDGLGAYVHRATGFPVIGVAKNYFIGTPEEAKVVRNNANPLFVTAIGGDVEAARGCIQGMAGDYRIPGMLKHVDHVCRTHQQPC